METDAHIDASEQLNEFTSKHHSIRYILLQWVDYSAIQHAQIVPLYVARKLASGELDPFTTAESCMIVPISTAPRFFPAGPETWELHPDWSSLTLCGFRPSHASVMCFTYQVGVSSPLASCPRALLKKVVQDFESRHSTSLLAGFEVEFSLLDETLKPPATPLDPVLGHSTISGLRDGTLEMLEEMVEALELAGIPVKKLHTEGIDTFEIAMDPKDPIAAIDSLMCAHETIRTIAIRQGLKATFAVQPQLTGALNGRNGSHLHLSLNPAPEADSFMAGILCKMTSLCAIGMANWDSYVRIGVEGTGAWIGYGTQNRLLPIRKITNNHWELRFVDATANMYLFLATVLSAGSDGITSSRALEWKDLTTYPSNLDQTERSRYGIERQMPHDLQVAVNELKDDKDAQRWMGRTLHTQFTNIKDIECTNWIHISAEERRQRFIKFY